MSNYRRWTLLAEALKLRPEVAISVPCENDWQYEKCRAGIYKATRHLGLKVHIKREPTRLLAWCRVMGPLPPATESHEYEWQATQRFQRASAPPDKSGEMGRG